MEAKGEAQRRLEGLIRGIEVAMLTTVEPDGELRSRPMVTAGLEPGGRLWFFTRTHTHKTTDIELDQHVNVSYASRKEERYVSVSGRARIVRDPRKAHALWTPKLDAWFPHGATSPDLELLCVDVVRAELWDERVRGMVELEGFEVAQPEREVEAPAEWDRSPPGIH